MVLMWKELTVWKLMLLQWLSTMTNEEASTTDGVCACQLVFETISDGLLVFEVAGDGWSVL